MHQLPQFCRAVTDTNEVLKETMFGNIVAKALQKTVNTTKKWRMSTGPTGFLRLVGLLRYRCMFPIPTHVCPIALTPKTTLGSEVWEALSFQSITRKQTDNGSVSTEGLDRKEYHLSTKAFTSLPWTNSPVCYPHRQITTACNSNSQ